MTSNQRTILASHLIHKLTAAHKRLFCKLSSRRDKNLVWPLESEIERELARPLIQSGEEENEDFQEFTAEMLTKNRKLIIF